MFLVHSWVSGALFYLTNTSHSLMNNTEDAWCEGKPLELPNGMLRVSCKSYKLIWTLCPVVTLKPLLNPNKTIYSSSYTFPGVAVRQYSLVIADPGSDSTLTHYRSEAAPTVSGPRAGGRDGCGSVGVAPPWVFRAHPGGSNRKSRARILVPALVIIYWAWVSVGTLWWWILMGLMITLPMRLINIITSYWACAAACDKSRTCVIITHRWQTMCGGQ